MTNIFEYSMIGAVIGWGYCHRSIKTKKTILIFSLIYCHFIFLSIYDNDYLPSMPAVASVILAGSVLIFMNRRNVALAWRETCLALMPLLAVPLNLLFDGYTPFVLITLIGMFLISFRYKE